MLYKLISFRYGLKEQSTKMVSKMNFIYVLSILNLIFINILISHFFNLRI